MIVTSSAKALRKWLEDLSFYLMKTGGGCYGLFLHRIRVEASPRPVAGRFPVAIGMNQSGQVRLRLHWPFVESLQMGAASELLKHEILHVVFGHLSSRRLRCCEVFGSDVYNMACDLVVNQHVNLKILRQAGLSPRTVEDMNLPKDMTTVWYCEALTGQHPNCMSEKKVKPVTRGARPDLFADYQQGPVDLNQPDPADVEVLEPVKPGPLWEAFDNTKMPPEMVDLNVDKVLTETRQEAELLGIAKETSSDRYSSNGRGWQAREALEFIEQVRRKPQMPWFAKLRQMESRFRGQERVPSIVRPSRRHPLHMGRSRKASLLVWFGIDTSGSMGRERLELVDPELKGISQRGATIMVLQSDAKIQAKALYDPQRGLKHFKGMGGTDFSPFLYELRDLPRADRPNFAVFYTDGYGCISGYLQRVQKEMGRNAWRRFCDRKSTKTPEGIELLWLIPEGSVDPELFRNDVAIFGHVAQIPLAKR